MEEAPACFVCFEATTERCLCACVNRYAHVACLLKLHAPRQCVRCTVCTKPIRNMRVTTETRTQLSYNTIVLIGSCTVWSFSVGVAVFLTLPTSRVYHYRLTGALAIFFYVTFTMGFLVCIRALYCWRVRRRALLWRRSSTRVLACSAEVANAPFSDEMSQSSF